VNNVYPIAVSAAADQKTVTIKVSGLGTNGVQAKLKAQGFEILGADQIWHSAPIESSSADTVTVGPVPAGPIAVRYLYYKAPCGQQPYQCPIYTDVAPLGPLSGEEQEFLPLSPFVMKIA